MAKISRTQFLERLQNDWGAYVERFKRLPAQEQQLFLNKQGYDSLGDLLAHVTAWWSDGADYIAHSCSDPDLPLPQYDVDEFNARAVKQFGGFSEADVIRTFQAQMQKMAALVENLTDAQLDSENINTRLYYEIMMHWTEHELVA